MNTSNTALLVFATLSIGSVTTTKAVDTFPTTAAIDQFVVRTWKANGTPGVSVAVVKNGKLVFAKGYGFADLQNSVPAQDTTVYRLGSVTKQFTATIIMQLVGEGKLKLDDTLGKVLPDSPASWSAVTVKQLLSHTAGIPNYTATPDFLKLIRGETTPEHINDSVAAKPLEFTPGTKWNYSNSGYILLGLIVQKIEGRPFAESLKARILKPLGMEHTYFTSEAEVVRHRAQGYTFNGATFKNSAYINMVWPFAAGSMESTVLDLAKWDAALYGTQILPRAALEQMWTSVKLTDGSDSKYGFGWQIEPINSFTTVQHGGGIPGFATMVYRVPSLGITTIVLMNSDTATPWKLATGLTSFVEPRLVVKPIPGIKDSDPTTTSIVKKGLLSLMSGQPDVAIYSPEMLKLFSPEMLKGVKAQAAALGELESMTLLTQSDREGVKVRTYHLKFRNAELTGDFVLSKAGIIIGAKFH